MAARHWLAATRAARERDAARDPRNITMKRRTLLILLLLTCRGSARAQVRTEDARLQATDGAPNDRFGAAIDIDGDRAVVGTYAHAGRGAAYLYARDPGAPSSWVLEKKIVPVD